MLMAEREHDERRKINLAAKTVAARIPHIRLATSLTKISNVRDRAQRLEDFSW